MPRVKRRNPPSVYIIEAILQAVYEHSMDVMSATNVMFALFNATPLSEIEEEADAKTSRRRVKAKADRVGADSAAGEGHVFGDKL